jgi:hypothetical protein
MNLCQFCDEILSKFGEHTCQHGESPWYVVYSHTVAEGTSILRSSALLGCYFCKQFWNSLTRRHQELLSDPDATECTVALFWDEQSAKFTKFQFFLGLEVDGCRDTGLSDTFEILDGHKGIIQAQRLLLKVSLTIADIDINQHQSPNIAGTQPLETLVTMRYRKCTGTHESTGCVQPATPWLPSRLVDIGDRSTGFRPCLILTEGLPHTDYPSFTLSHISADDFEGLLTGNFEQGYYPYLTVRRLTTIRLERLTIYNDTF